MSRCDDKRLTRRLVAEAGIVVPKGRLATFDEDDHAFLAEVGDVVVKPTRGEQGKGITVGVDRPDELDAALTRAREQHPRRADRAACAGRRSAAGGDRRQGGRRRAAHARRSRRHRASHRARADRGAEPAARPRRPAANPASPSTTSPRATVQEAGWSFDDVLPEGERLRVRRTANLHQGGTIHDVTAEVNPDAVRRSRWRPPKRSASRSPASTCWCPTSPRPSTPSSRPTSARALPTTSRSRRRRRSSTTCSPAPRRCRRRGRLPRRLH